MPKPGFKAALIGSACLAALLFAAWRWLPRDRFREGPVLPPAAPFAPAIASSVVPAVSTTIPSPRRQPVKPVPSVPTSVAPRPEPDLPKEIRLAVPFLSQAPKKDWSMPYQEACEEASVLMVRAYYAGKKQKFTPEEGDRAILDFVAWQAAQYGPEKVDATADEMRQAAEGYAPELAGEVVAFSSAEQIKRLLADGIPVIVPADGKRLENPRFRNGGPLYHMLVVTGYLADGRWITNDPGTQFGENFLYSQENLVASIHDWNGGDVPNGAPRLLVLRRKGG